jgi:NADPH2:quinone reductase
VRVIQAEDLTSIDSYRVVERPAPSPGEGEVLIRVAACGVGYVDALVALGRYQVKPPTPHIPGNEISGVIEALGSGVSGLAVGDRVLAMARSGGFAELAIAPAVGTLALPRAMRFAQAAGFRVNYLTALHGLRDRAGLRPGERLLVFGAAGGVGAAAVQVGLALGAEVIAAASSPAKRDFAAGLGARGVMDVEPEGWRDRLKGVTGGKGVDVVFDPVCGPLFEAAFRSLAWGGRHLVVGFAAGKGIPALPSNLTIMKGAALTGVDVRQFLLFEPARAGAQLAELLAWVGEERLVPPVGRVFGFDAASEALTFALSGRGSGKTILVVGEGDPDSPAAKSP